MLVNSNPATIQTDVDMADEVYVEPLTLKLWLRSLKRKTLTLFYRLGRANWTECFNWFRKICALEGVKVIGSSIQTIKNVEDRDPLDSFMKTLNELSPS